MKNLKTLLNYFNVLMHKFLYLKKNETFYIVCMLNFSCCLNKSLFLTELNKSYNNCGRKINIEHKKGMIFFLGKSSCIHPIRKIFDSYFSNLNIFSFPSHSFFFFFFDKKNKSFLHLKESILGSFILSVHAKWKLVILRLA